jgi:hypothetical protein
MAPCQTRPACRRAHVVAVDGQSAGRKELVMLNDAALARAIHVVAIVVWIGGVSFVTTVLLPAIRRAHPPQERLAVFLRYESAFSWQARISVAAAGISGLYLVWRFNMWARFGQAQYWTVAGLRGAIVRDRAAGPAQAAGGRSRHGGFGRDVRANGAYAPNITGI